MKFVNICLGIIAGLCLSNISYIKDTIDPRVISLITWSIVVISILGGVYD